MGFRESDRARRFLKCVPKKTREYGLIGLKFSGIFAKVSARRNDHRNDGAAKT